MSKAKSDKFKSRIFFNLTFSSKALIFTKTMTKLFKNILLLTLTGLFFMINTGFTLSLHYCNMQKETSFSGCGMCEAPSDNDKVCSKEESTSGELSFSKIPHKCCQAVLGAIAGTDEYLLTQLESTVKSLHIDLIQFTFQQDEYSTDFSSNFFSDSSPPTETTLKLFLSNHNFRI